ncbi:transcription antitermination factor NusB [Candidatus Curtissbacteria bacterium RIFCSPLOWO2_01_FULL_39_62]|uniref:Transcription antitermination factor NusB n=2 Tax=Candidatus Curtissiibacteriota TaxID=1752717 RepID=A0A1F5G6I4_9BACT|nr:MAG: transcription antitermination factor NusB [Candidatus Curtissbacteria bacterium RIFCSPHIGHO2_02_FULL_40_16b]OGD90715.1 MAG: transcription antitermination factor NusB [Candidatus Curtissbacteria bacterium RIFCSPHIGHO2_12_FULL_38_37]OGE00688.1 MAG: transcription antitermination factor NusB [Candidatus Curtissbacteria bacterium RIFCSPLOWO2_02_FULL_40_11]OGE01012.1 MAG: transcription antitermination factor NusB [Candidatus Curtissbacteria bacterium RIFCSPLOWO2_01_FULL_39_62]OGE12666.1 MAG: 
MKRKADPRHQLRVKIMKQLFEKNFRESLELSKPSDALEIYSDRKKIDKIITTNAPAWPLNQIPPVDLATLRLAIWELKFKRKKEPYKVVIDEAVEIAKEFGTGASPSFINGVLGSVVKKEIKHD